MARREGEGRQKDGEIAETREQLAAAEAKIQVGIVLYRKHIMHTYHYASELWVYQLLNL